MAVPAGLCSVPVLAALGLLTLSAASVAQSAGTTLPAGTLPVLRGVVAGQVAVNRSAPGATRPELTVQQDSQRAIIDWKSFNISADAAVRFNQPGSTASALNRIYGVDPTVIQGQLSANGQVILINQNGILFDRGASVNVQSLVASTLNLKMSNAQFCGGDLVACATGQALSAGGLSTEAFGGGYNDDGTTTADGRRPNGQPPGTIALGSFGPATAAAPQLQATQGGSILLFAPRIDNNGGIVRAPDGQVVLAAGQKVYLGISDDSADTTLRGFVVEVEAVTDDVRLDLTNLVRNAGDISADRGNVTLAGLTVNQEGRVSAKTAVQSNGSIYLKARSVGKAEGDEAASLARGQAGTASFAKGSVTEVMPDTADATTVSDSTDTTAFRGVVDVRGGVIEQRGTVQAAGGVINLVASNAAQPTAARVYLDADSLTSVAGTWADVDFTKNIVSFRVTSNELKDAPDQKDGLLRGATVTVDLRQGSNILDLSGYRGAVARTVAEKTAVGGSMVISSEGDVIQRSGAVLDASGGGYRYSGGTAAVSRVLGADGKVYDLATAPEALTLVAQLDRFERTDSRWGQTVSIANPLGAVATYEAGYVEGKAGGDISINAASGLVLDGALKGGVTVGPKQTAAAPAAATLNIGSSDLDGRVAASLVFRRAAADTLGNGFGLTSTLGLAQQQGFTLAADQLYAQGEDTADGRVEHGFGSVNVYLKRSADDQGGSVTLPADVALHGEPGAALKLDAFSLDLGGAIVLPGGSLSLVANPLSDARQAGAGTVVRSTATLSTAGTWLNLAPPDGAPLQVTGRLLADGSTRSATQGGSLSLGIGNAFVPTIIERGALLDVSGGGLVQADHSVTGGAGGSLSVATGAEAALTSDWLQGELRGFGSGTTRSAAAGGTLALALGSVVIADDSTNGVLPAGTTRLDPGLFSDFGFSKLSISAGGDVVLAPDTALVVEQKTRVVDLDRAPAALSGADVATLADVQRLPDWQRGAASLSLAASGRSDATGTLTLSDGAAISADPRASISLKAVDGMDIRGAVRAPGGSINLTLAAGPQAEASAPLHLAAGATLDVAGTFIATPSTLGLVQGTLLDGGSVTLTGSNAGVVVDAGARIDLHGVAQTVDVTRTGSAPQGERRTLEGSAGTLAIHTEGVFSLAGTLDARAGGATAAGGSFALESQAPGIRGAAFPDERRIVVTHGPQALAPQDGVVDAPIDTTQLEAAGFDKLRLQSENRIAFDGDATLAFARGLRLDAPALDVADGARVHLAGSTVSLGQSWGARVASTPDDPQVSVWALDNTLAAPAVATRAGTGTLAVDAGWVDLFGAFTINGSALTTLHSDADVRLLGRTITYNNDLGNQVTGLFGSLTTPGNLEIDAAQVYATTRSSFALAVKDSASGSSVPGGYLRISSSGQAAGSVYSAASQLTLQADHLVQDGRLLAPLGQIALNADTAVSLGAGSVTSVSADGLTIPYGTTSAGTQWLYDDGAANTLLQSVSTQDKGVAITTPALSVRPGATVDLSGGGNVQASEFVAGSGGSKDITVAANTYAIVPAASLAAAPVDANIQALQDIGSGFSFTANRDAARYDSITLGAGSAVAAGTYVLLPARYALLPGAYLVELQTGSAWRNLQLGQTAALANGQTVVAGFRSASGTAVRDPLSVGVVVRSGPAAVAKSSDLTLTGAEFFAAAAEADRSTAPVAPWDAGRLVLQGLQSLTVDGQFKTAAATNATYGAGRTAEVDIAGDTIAVVGAATAAVPEGTLKISSASLNAFNASVLLGGTRSVGDDGVTVTTTARQITVANDATAPVSVPELLLSATDRIDVQAGAVLEATGSGGAVAPVTLLAESSGALLRLSSGAQATVQRTQASADAGQIDIAVGATLRASKSLLLDATQGTTSAGLLQVGGEQGAGGSLALSATQVALGDAPAATGTLVLGASALAGFSALDEFIVHGHDGIDVVGAVDFGSPTLAALTLDTPLLRAVAAGPQAPAATLTAGHVTLRNSGSTQAVAAAGSGTLTVQSQVLTLDKGEKAIAGVAGTTLVAGERVEVQGAGALRAAGDLSLQTPLLQALSGSAQTLSAEDNQQADALVRGHLSVAGSGTTAVAADGVQLGGRLTLQGASVAVDSTLQARSGVIRVQALGGTAADGITLGAGGRLDARGQAQDFYGTAAVASGGQVSLNAGAGAVALDAGSAIDVSAADEGGAAGRLEITAAALRTQGTLAGTAASGAPSGTAVLDLDALTDFSALNTQLNAGGFAAERDLRLRSGTLTVAAADQVAAERVTLSADQGGITVLGTVGSGATAGGGRVDLFAAGDIRLAGGSRIVAGTTAEGGKGGEVRVASADGGVRFEPGAVVDVRAGRGGMAGGVVFGVGRDGEDRLAPLSLQGQVLRGGGVAAASVDVEATRRYDRTGIPLDDTQVAALAEDHRAFIAHADATGLGAALMAGLSDENGAVTDARLLGATEVRSGDALTVTGAIALTDTATWYSGARPGTLTLRAAGDLTVLQSIGHGDDSVQRGDTWNLRLAAGADLGAANPLATATGGSGNLVLGSADAKLRTGTGRIDLAAAGDIRFDDTGATVYTAGRIGVADALNKVDADGNPTVSYDRWTVDGGGISLAAGGRIVGGPDGAESLWVNDWLRRSVRTGTTPRDVDASLLTEWWTYRAAFAQGVGSFGGGDITVAAGADVEHLSLALPSSGRTVYAGDQRGVDVQGGGNLTLRVGGNLVGGDIVLGRGTGRVDVVGEAGAGQGVQVWLQGLNGSGERAQQTRIDISAGDAATLASVANPTALYLPRESAVNGSPDPSLGNSGQVASFFTYGSDTALNLQAKGGDATFGYLAAAPRSADGSTGRVVTGVPAVLPPQFSLQSFGGDVGLDATVATSIQPLTVLFPSVQSSLQLLASDSVQAFPIRVSDLDPGLVLSPTAPITERDNAFSNSRRFLLSGTNPGSDVNRVLASGTDARIVERPDSGGTPPFRFIALAGDVLGTVDPWLLPAPAQVIAGRDVLGLNATFQNLTDADVTTVRAVEGDIRHPQQIFVQGPGRLVLQAGRNIDLGGIVGVYALGNTVNTQLGSDQSARLTLVAGVHGDVDLARLDGADGVYTSLRWLSQYGSTVLGLYNQLALESDSRTVLAATSVADLAAGNPAYSRFLAVDANAPQALATYQRALRDQQLPLASSADVNAVAALYAQLNREADVARLQAAGSLAALAQQPGGEAYAGYLALAERYPVVYADYVQRRVQGATPTSLMPVVFSLALGDVVAQALPAASVSGSGNIATYQTSVQTYGGSSIDLLAPAGHVTVGATTDIAGKQIGVITNAGGGINAIAQGNFDINLGKVLTVQGGDILLYSSAASIDAGKGAKTAQVTAPPRRTVTVDDNGNVTVTVEFQAGATGSGIQTLTSDPDGLGPLTAPVAGDVYLFAPAGSIDAGEAGIKSSGSLVLNAQAVLNASNISAAGPTTGVPVLQTGSLASALAAGGSTTTPTQAAENAAKQAAEAARSAAAAAQAPKPTLLSVEVMGFGERNCREDDKDCFGK